MKSKNTGPASHICHDSTNNVYWDREDDGAVLLCRDAAQGLEVYRPVSPPAMTLLRMSSDLLPPAMTLQRMYLLPPCHDTTKNVYKPASPLP